ncbi:hypothetical protein [Halarchaeum sp. P4]|uniref:hypothetical protein n=1 Tax=Halarchaeum sp. P4 TaxID=3421639 RepID=UPI003EBFE91F
MSRDGESLDDVYRSSEEDGQFDLAYFVGDYSELFAIMGVFAALAVYISQSKTGTTPDFSLMRSVGFVSSFGLSLLMYLLIYSKLAEKLGGWPALYRTHIRVENGLLVVFSFLSAMLMGSLTSLLLEREPAFFMILLVAAVFLTYVISFRVLRTTSSFIPDDELSRAAVLLVSSCAILLITEALYTQFVSSFQMTTVWELSLSTPLLVAANIAALVIAVIRSLAMYAVVISALYAPVALYRRYR